MKNDNSNVKKTDAKGGISLFKSNEIMMLIVLIVVIAIFSIMNGNYLTYNNMTNILVAASTIGMLAIGETFLIIAGHIDLSSAHIVSLFGVMTALLINGGMPWPCLLYTSFRSDTSEARPAASGPAYHNACRWCV